ncbi:MAG: cell division protein FtsA [Terriglobia bacterium]
MKQPERYLAGLDLGSSKICALLCEVDAGGRLHLRGTGVAESKGFRKGSLVSLQAAVSAIRQAVEAAEAAAGVPLESALIGVAGSHIKGINSRGGITLGARPREVTLNDVRRAIAAARAVTLPAEREVLHVLPQEFFLDQQNGLRDPVGMLGTKLEVNVHIVTADGLATQNLVTAVNRAGVLVLDTVLEPLASAETCLTADERELGVLLVDMGGGTTEWMVYEHHAPRLTGVVPVGGEHFTHDIAVGLRTPLWEAERLKRAYGCAGLRWLRQDTLVDIAGSGGRVASRRALCEIIEARASELFALIRDDLLRSGTDRQLGAGVVLTGGGAQLDSLAELAAEILQLPARLGKPTGVLGLPATPGAIHTLKSPACATAVGLVLHGNRIRALRQRQAGVLDRLKSFWQRKGWAA